MSLQRNISANYVGAGWSALMTLAFIPLYIRYLGVEAYGLIGIFAMLQGFFSLLDLGLAPTISREMARFQSGEKNAKFARDLLRSVEAVALIIAVLMVLFFQLASPWLARHWLSAKGLGVDVIARTLMIFGGLIGLRIVENIYRSTLIGLQRQISLNLIIVIVATLRGVGAVVVLVFIADSIRAFFIWQLAVSSFSIAMLSTRTYRILPVAHTRAVFSPSVLKSIRRFAAGAMAITCLSLLLSNIDKILLSRLLPLDVFGYYAFAVVVAQTPLGFVPPIAQAFYPRFTHFHSQNDQVSLARAYHAATQLVTVLLGAATIFLIFFGRDVLELWTRNPSLSDRTYELASILSVGSLFNGIMTIPYYLQLSAGWTGLTLRINSFALFFMVPALLIFVPQFGAMAAAWIWLTLNFFYVIVLIPIMHRRLLPDQRWSWYLRDVGTPLIAALGTGWLLSLVLHSTPGGHRGVLALITCALLITSLTALAAPLIRERFFELLLRRF